MEGLIYSLFAFVSLIWWNDICISQWLLQVITVSIAMRVYQTLFNADFCGFKNMINLSLKIIYS